MRLLRSYLPAKPTCLPLILLLASIPLLSCASDKSQIRSPVDVSISQESGFDPANVKMAAIVEFLEYRPYTKPGHRVEGPLIKARVKGGEVATGSGASVADHFRSALEKQGVIVVDDVEVQEALGGKAALDRDYYKLKLGVRIGEKLEVDTVVMGVVMRFEERIGSKIAVDRPASVGFSVAVIDINRQKIVWAGKYEKTQKPLFENLLDFRTFFKGGMVWVTADELSGIGVGRTIKMMGYKNPAQ